MTNTVFDKTDKGRTEIATRANRLAARQRTLLLLVDGHRDTIELMEKVAGLGLNEKALVELLKGGFIQVHRASADTATATDTAPAPAGAESDAAVSGGSAAAESDQAPAARAAYSDDATGVRGAATKGILRDGETQYQALYNFYNETIRSAIGLRGYALQLKVERATTIADFRVLRQAYLDGVLKAKGPELEHSLRNRLDQLLSLGD